MATVASVTELDRSLQHCQVRVEQLSSGAESSSSLVIAHQHQKLQTKCEPRICDDDMKMYTDQQYSQHYGEEGWFGELIAAPLDHRYHEAVSHAVLPAPNAVSWQKQLTVKIQTSSGPTVYVLSQHC